MLRKLISTLGSASASCAVAQAGLIRCHSSVFYDSQSGQTMTVPGSAGVRVHELLCSVSGRGLGAMQAAKVSSIQWNLEEGLAPSGASELVIPISNVEEVQRSFSSAARPQGAALCPLVTLELSAVVHEAKLRHAEELVKACMDMGLKPRVLLRHAWSSGDDPDENLHGRSLESATATMADAQAAVITYSDCMGQATEGSLRDAVEAAFNMDVSGETMLERLALRLPPKEDLCMEALKLGVTRFDTNACPHAASGSKPGSMCIRPVSCLCNQAGVGNVIGTEQLLSWVEKQGLRHGVDLKALHAASAVLRES